MTFSHNRGGPYVRNRVVPTNPGTVFQAAIRGFVASLTSQWLNVLTFGQRAGWDLYAENVLLPSPLGDPRNVGGLGMFIRSNVVRLQAFEAAVLDAPSVFNLGEFSAPAIVTATAPAAISLSFDANDAWAGEDDAFMLVYGGRGQNASINYFKGPYRYCHKIAGDGITPPTSPEAVTNPFDMIAGQKSFIRTQVIRADGRLSADARTFQIVV
jgi:hypothetical protein